MIFFLRQICGDGQTSAAAMSGKTIISGKPKESLIVVDTCFPSAGHLDSCHGDLVARGGLTALSCRAYEGLGRCGVCREVIAK